MTRTRRMQPVQRLMDDGERRHAQRLADAQQRLAAAEHKLAELERYRQEYVQSFDQRATTGATGLALRDFQVFLGRLSQAVQQQAQLVARLRDDVAAETRQWQVAARKARALGSVVEQWRGEERRAQDRQEQKETDERAQQLLHASLRRP